MATLKQLGPSIRRSVIFGWISWLLICAISMFADSGGTAPFTRPVAFVLFSGFYSAFYLLDYVAIVPVTYIALNRLWPSSRPWQWAVVGGIAFALSVPLWEAVFDHRDRADTIFSCILGATAGVIAFYELRRPHPSKSMSERFS